MARYSGKSSTLPSPAYLRGIETNLVNLAILVLHRSPAYLRGIETVRSIRLRILRRKVSSLPKRN